MRIRVRLLRPFSDAVGRPEVEVAVPQEATVRHLLEHLCEQYPDLRQQVYESGGGMTEYLSMFLNDRPVTDLEMTLKEGDEVLMLMPVSGG